MTPVDSTDDIDSTKIRCISGRWIYQREECDPHSTDLCGAEEELCGSAFLGQGLFRIDSWSRRASDTRVYTAPGKGGSSSRSNGADVVDPFRGIKEPQAPFKPLRAAHKTKAPGFAGGYLLANSRLSWVDAFSFGPDGYLYTVVNQLHRSAVLNGGEAATIPPYLILRFKPLATGTTGR